MLIDTHCHIQFKAFYENIDEVIERCRARGMILNVVGTQLDTSRGALALAEKYDWMYASVGLHPIQEYRTQVVEEADKFISRGEEFDAAAYDELAGHEKVIALGETGLDRFHVPKDVVTEVVLERQKKTFLQHAQIAQRHNLPLVIHVREAHKDMTDLLQSGQVSPRGVIHSFSGGWEEARIYLSHGLYLGFTGVVTFPQKKTDLESHRGLLEVLAKVPLDRVLVETDSPYLAPQKYRGKRSEPWMAQEVLLKLSEIRGIPVSELEELTAQNALNLFTRMK